MSYKSLKKSMEGKIALVSRPGLTCLVGRAAIRVELRVSLMESIFLKVVGFPSVAWLLDAPIKPAVGVDVITPSTLMAKCWDELTLMVGSLPLG